MMTFLWHSKSIDPPEVQRTKWTLAGELLHKEQFYLTELSGDMDRTMLESSQTDPAGWKNHTYGHKTVRSIPIYDDEVGNLCLDLIYDYVFDDLSVRWNMLASHLLPGPGCHAALTPHVVYSWLFDFKMLEIVDAENDTASTEWYRVHVGEVSVREWFGSPAAKYPFLLFGDREVLVWPMKMASSSGSSIPTSLRIFRVPSLSFQWRRVDELVGYTLLGCPPSELLHKSSSILGVHLLLIVNR